MSSPKRRRINGPESSQHNSISKTSSTLQQSISPHLPPSPYPISEHAADPIPADTASQLLAISCAQILRQQGYSGWEKSAGVRFQGLVEEFLINATQQVSRYMLAARRASPTPQDFLEALPHLRDLDVDTISHLNTPPTTPPETKTSPPPIPNGTSEPPPGPPSRKRKRALTLLPPEHAADPLPLTPPSSPGLPPEFSEDHDKFMGPGPEPSAESFPPSCPPMPPAHTYCFTPVYMRSLDTATDASVTQDFRERVRQEGKKGEGALRGLLRKFAEAGGERSRAFGKRRREREEEWRKAWDAVGGEGGEGEVANYERGYWRKKRG